jgi:hypothetical protein
VPRHNEEEGEGDQRIPHASTYNTLPQYHAYVNCHEFKIFPKAVVQTKNTTRFEALTRHIPFQGKEAAS